MITIARAAPLMAGCRHHGSLRRVRSEICTLVLAGAAVTCVIGASPPCHSAWVTALEPYSTEYHRAGPEDGDMDVTLATPAVYSSFTRPAGRPAPGPGGGSPPGAGAGSPPPPP